MTDTMTITIEHTSNERWLLEHLGELGVTARACILGTGAAGEAAWPHIPLDAWLLGVNGAVEIPLPWPLHLHARMVFDNTVPRLPYWQAYQKETSALTILGASSELATEYCDYRFETSLEGVNGAYIPRALLADATVGGCALDMLRHVYLETGRPSTVYLCGLDFGGGYYFKRGENGERYRCTQPGKWDHAPRMNSLIRDCISRGMRVYTLSDTELEVEHAV